MEALVWIIVGIVLFAVFIWSISTLAYYLGMFFGAIASIFYIFSYIGASCTLINDIITWFLTNV